MVSNSASEPNRSASPQIHNGGAIECRPAEKGEIRAAVQLILSTRRGLAEEAQVVDFLRYAVQRGIDLNLMWVAVQGERLLWALLPMVSPGRTMLMFAPPMSPRPAQAPAARQLVDAITEHFARRDVDLSQVLTDPHEKSSQQMYQSCGFHALAELVYMQKLVRPPESPPQLPRGFQWHSYDPATTHALFTRTLTLSYRDSLDCPGLNGLRNIEDVIAGHKATGEFHPELWFVLTENFDDDGDAIDASATNRREPRGVLLLSGTPHTETLELVYLGLTPEARGRGLGDVLMQQALASVLRSGRSRLTLAVDSKNAPAIKLYYRHGMQRLSSRIAMMRDLRQPAAPVES